MITYTLVKETARGVLTWEIEVVNSDTIEKGRNVLLNSRRFCHIVYSVVVIITCF